MTLVLMAALISVVFGWALRGAFVTKSAADSDSSRTAVLRELVHEHVRIARDRISAAEARIAILEERQTFHDGFFQVVPRTWPGPYGSGHSGGDGRSAREVGPRPDRSDAGSRVVPFPSIPLRDRTKPESNP